MSTYAITGEHLELLTDGQNITTMSKVMGTSKSDILSIENFSEGVNAMQKHISGRRRIITHEEICIPSGGKENSC